MNRSKSALLCRSFSYKTKLHMRRTNIEPFTSIKKELRDFEAVAGFLSWSTSWKHLRQFYTLLPLCACLHSNADSDRAMGWMERKVMGLGRSNRKLKRGDRKEEEYEASVDQSQYMARGTFSLLYSLKGYSIALYDKYTTSWALH